MKNIIKSKAKEILLKRLIKGGKSIQNISEKKDILKLIKKVVPVKLKKELIRLGPAHDGGYLIIDDLDGIEACFSPGVDTIAGFEEDCAIKYGMKIFMADKSVDAPPKMRKGVNFEFIKKFIGVYDDKDFITLDTWVNNSKINKESDLLLQMDIEGSEYYTLLNLSFKLQKRFRIIIVEFHDLDKLWIPEFYELADSTFSKLLKTHFCVHIHPNNCCPISTFKDVEIPNTMEFTFHRNDRLQRIEGKIEYPNPLDFINLIGKPNIVLPSLWQGN